MFQFLALFVKKSLQWLKMPFSGAKRDDFLSGCMGVDLLPEKVNKISNGQTTAIVCSEKSLEQIWFQSFLLSLLEKSSVFLLAENKKWVDALLADHLLEKAYLNGSLSVMLTTEKIDEEIKKFGLHAVYSELIDNNYHTGQSLIWVSSHGWLNKLSSSQLKKSAIDNDVYLKNKLTNILFIFIDSGDVSFNLKKIKFSIDLFQNLAFFSSDRQSYFLSFVRWNNLNNLILDFDCGIDFDVSNKKIKFNGCLLLGQNKEISSAVDKGAVYITQPALDGQRNLPSNWKVLSHAGEGTSAVVNSIAATIILHAGSVNDFETLIRVVFHLRQTHPKTLKIIVRENDAKLRLNIERALLYFGANLVIYREVGFSRIVKIVEDISNQTFSGDLNILYAEEIKSFLPDSERGYIEPVAFHSYVSKVVKRTVSTHITHTLVRLFLSPTVPHIDAINACNVFRDGDLLTSASDSIYVFLFACAEVDIDSALDRMFVMPVSQLFSSQVSDSSVEGIEKMLDEFSHSMKDGYVDYSLTVHPVKTNVIRLPLKAKSHASRSEVNKLPSLPNSSSSPSALLGGHAPRPQVRSIQLKQKVHISHEERVA